MSSLQDRVRQVLRAQKALRVDVDTLTPEADLFAAGLNSFASVDLMLAIEQTFDVVFPDEALTRRTFGSIASIAAAVERLTAGTTA
jgi:acyl carrier protein